MAVSYQDRGTGHFEGMDADSIEFLSRCLRNCKSTSALSFTAVSLLTKTLTARATRLESIASKVHLAAEREAHRTKTAAKRRRESGPKNAYEFMRQTLRDREIIVQENNRLRAERERFNASRLADAAVCPSRALFRPGRESCPRKAPGLSPRKSSQACSSECSTRLNMALNGSCKGQPPTLDPRVIQRPSSWTLEEDDDVRGLLDKTIGNAHNTRSIMVGPVFTDVAGPSVQTRPASSQPYGRSGSRARSAQGAPAFTGYKGGARRPQTAAGVRRETTLDAKEYGRSDIVQLRREMLIRSHGQGNNLDTFAAQPFQATAMGRRARYGRALDRSEAPAVENADEQTASGYESPVEEMMEIGGKLKGGAHGPSLPRRAHRTSPTIVYSYCLGSSHVERSAEPLRTSVVVHSDLRTAVAARNKLRGIWS